MGPGVQKMFSQELPDLYLIEAAGAKFNVEPVLRHSLCGRGFRRCFRGGRVQPTAQIDREHRADPVRSAVDDHEVGHHLAREHAGRTDRDTSEILGWTGFGHLTTEPEPELGWFTTPAAEGKGVAFAAACAARDWCFSALGWASVVSYIDPANTRSIALAERMGATYEREGKVMGLPCQVWRHPQIDVTTPALTTERTGQ